MSRQLKALRQLKGLTQNDVAKLLGLSLHGYLNKENGKSQFTLNEAKKLADMFDVTVDDIFFNNKVINLITNNKQCLV